LTVDFFEGVKIPEASGIRQLYQCEENNCGGTANGNPGTLVTHWEASIKEVGVATGSSPIPP
jgi:hypothetical protein